MEDASALPALAEFAVDAALAHGLIFRTAETPTSSANVQPAPFALFRVMIMIA